jgi:hypothetical protein
MRRQSGSASTLGSGSFYSSFHKQKWTTNAGGNILGTRNYRISRGFNLPPACLGQDNQSTIQVIRNGIRSGRRLKHLDNKIFFLKDYIEEKQLVVDYVPTECMVVDLLTKPLPANQFICLRDKLLGYDKKMDCDDLAYELRDLGYLVGTIHGNKEQNARTLILNKFRTGDIRVLVATDVAARGIDIKDIEVVINYDFPVGKGSAVEDYVHRIGRTARGERTGIAHSFFTPENAPCAPQLVELLRRSGHVSLLPLFSPSPLVPDLIFPLSLSTSRDAAGGPSPITDFREPPLATTFQKSR